MKYQTSFWFDLGKNIKNVWKRRDSETTLHLPFKFYEM